jgi:hypothetical protein
MSLGQNGDIDISGELDITNAPVAATAATFTARSRALRKCVDNDRVHALNDFGASNGRLYFQRRHTAGRSYCHSRFSCAHERNPALAKWVPHQRHRRSSRTSKSEQSPAMLLFTHVAEARLHNPIDLVPAIAKRQVVAGSLESAARLERAQNGIVDALAGIDVASEDD